MPGTADHTRSSEVWILGATGRIGRAVTARLVDRGTSPVLVGRESDLLRTTAASLGLQTVIADGGDAIAAEIGRQRPAVVVNAIGNYAETATNLARACMPGGHCVDLAADLTAVQRLLDLHEEAASQGSTLVTGSGFGVLATEAVVVKLCENRPAPAAVRVDALSSVATEEGVIGAGFATSIIDSVTTGGRRYQDGRIVSARLGADPQHLILPDGEDVKSAGAPSAELLAAQRASNAPSVIATSALMPTSPVVRALLPLLSLLVSIPALQRLAVRQLARTKLKAAPRPRQHSWGHAVITWPDGTRREGWLRADDGMDYTAAVATEVAVQLAKGAGKPGAYTPAAALGSGIAVAAGGTFLLG